MNKFLAHTIHLLSISIILLCATACHEASSNLPQNVDFNYHIKPILSQNCFVCHGPDSSSRKGNFRLDNYAGATAKLSDGSFAIKPKSVRSSQIIERISSQDPLFQMPPPEMKKKLTKREIDLLEKWISEGAEYKDHWSLVKPQVEENLLERSAVDVIDRLISEPLNGQGLEPSPAAKWHSIHRRIAYMLTGLPPSVSELERFSVDRNVESVIDFYIASPHFGEHWARHWMDLVRYAEHLGHEFDFPISGAWHYRDYLIRAFNQDVSYDQLVLEHLAGDVLPNPRTHLQTGLNESALGTAFYHLGEGKHSPVSTKEEESIKFDNIIDVISKTFQGLTVACAKCHDHKFDPIPTTDYYALYGIIESSRMTPVVADIQEIDPRYADSLRSMVNSVNAEMITPRRARIITDDEAEILADFSQETFGEWMPKGQAFGKTPIHQVSTKAGKVEVFDQRFASSRYYNAGQTGSLHSPTVLLSHDSLLIRARGKGSSIRVIVNNFHLIRYPLYGNLEIVLNNDEFQDYVIDLALVQGQKAYVELQQGHYENNQFLLHSDDYVEVETIAFFNKQKPNLTKAKRIHAKVIPQLEERYPRQPRLTLPNAPFVMGMTTGDLIRSPVFIKGDFKNPSPDLVSHQFLSAVDSVPFDSAKNSRLQYAHAIIDEENPLTARVMVNRIWHHLFGKGIVPTVDNFGVQGAMPSNPALLDYLAVRFMQDGWSIKSMIKNIMLSEAFQRSSQVLNKNQEQDPENKLWHHYPIRRLQAESIRDAILTSSGSLDTTLHGEPVEVYLTSFMTGRGRPKESGPIDGAGRRSIYQKIRRNFLSPMMLAYDMPIPFTTFGKRDVTNVPNQSLTLMNDPFVHGESKNMAKRLTSGDKSIDEALEMAYRIAYSRSPTEEEVQLAINFFEQYALEHKEDVIGSMESWEAFCHALINMKEFIYLM